MERLRAVLWAWLRCRQGALEQNAIKEVGHYNRILAAGEALKDLHTRPTTTFCICPGAELEVGT